MTNKIIAILLFLLILTLIFIYYRVDKMFNEVKPVIETLKSLG